MQDYHNPAAKGVENFSCVRKGAVNYFASGVSGECFAIWSWKISCKVKVGEWRGRSIIRISHPKDGRHQPKLRWKGEGTKYRSDSRDVLYV